MFKVKNGTGAAFAFDLEKGSTMLHKGAVLDLEGLCSRKWLRSDPQFNRLIDIGALAVIFDSELEVPKQPVHDIVGSEARLQPVKPKKVEQEEPTIVDFSKEDGFEIVEEDDDDFDFESHEEELEELADTVVQEEPKEELIVTGHACDKCGKVCKSLSGLASHMRVHKKEEDVD